MRDEDLETRVMKDPGGVARFILKSSERDEIINWLLNQLEMSVDKKLKKSYKKVIYILKSNGIDIDNLKNNKKSQKTDEISQNSNLGQKPYRAFLFLPDSYGNTRMLVSFYNELQTNYEVYDFIFNMDDGIKQFQKQKASKKGIDRITQIENEMVEIDIKYALSRLKDVSVKTNTLEKLPDEIKHYIDDIGIEIHPVLSIYPASLSSIVSADEEKELFSRPEITRLMIPDDYVKGYKDEVIKAQNSILIVNNLTPKERINKTISRFIQNYFTHERLGMYRIILLDIALYLHSKGEAILAKRLVGYAENLKNPIMDGMFNIDSHPLIRLLVYKSFFID